MKTFDCPKCGAPISYEPDALGGNVRCAYCQSQLALPEHGRPARIISQIDINVSPHITATATKWLWFLILVPIVIVVIVIGGVFGALAPLMRSAGVSKPSSTSPFGSKAGDPANSFAHEVLSFGSEGIGPGMMKDARSIAVDGQGRIYVGEYQGGRIQVFDASGKFITQWMVNPKMPLPAIAADRKGIVYVVQSGKITKFDGETGQPVGEIPYADGWGFEDVIVTADGGLLCSWYRNRDDIVAFDSRGNVTRTIRAAISTASGESELETRVAMDGLGNIYTLGVFNDAVFKFGPDGRFLNRFGSKGKEAGEFTAPDAIAVDGKGRIYVADFGTIKIFDSNGRYLDEIRAGGAVSGMVFNDNNELFVAARTKVTKFKVKD